jgi:hypothetical protein
MTGSNKTFAKSATVHKSPPGKPGTPSGKKTGTVTGIHTPDGMKRFMDKNRVRGPPVASISSSELASPS